MGDCDQWFHDFSEEAIPVHGDKTDPGSRSAEEQEVIERCTGSIVF